MLLGFMVFVAFVLFAGVYAVSPAREEGEGAIEHGIEEVDPLRKFAFRFIPAPFHFVYKYTAIVDSIVPDPTPPASTGRGVSAPRQG